MVAVFGSKWGSKLPNIWDDMKKDQKIPLNMPLFSSVAQIDMYFPWATHRIEAPKPLMEAAMRMTTVMKVELMFASGD